MAAVGSSLGGLLVDKIGQRVRLMLLASIGTAVTHAVLGYTSYPPTAPLIFLGEWWLNQPVRLVLPHCAVLLLLCWPGLCYVLFASASWPAISHVVSKQYLGTAFGVAAALQNTGLAAVPLAVGWIKDSTHSDTAVEVALTSLWRDMVVCGCPHACSWCQTDALCGHELRGGAARHSPQH